MPHDATTKRFGRYYRFGGPFRSFTPSVAATALVACLGIPVDASAGNLNVSVKEHDDVSVIEVRSDDGEIGQPSVSWSEKGALLFFLDEYVEPGRSYSTGKRLHYVQTGHAGNRAVVRVMQRSQAKGTLRDFFRRVPRPGGFDLEVRHQKYSKVGTPASDSPVTTGLSLADRITKPTKTATPEDSTLKAIDRATSPEPRPAAATTTDTTPPVTDAAPTARASTASPPATRLGLQPSPDVPATESVEPVTAPDPTPLSPIDLEGAPAWTREQAAVWPTSVLAMLGLSFIAVGATLWLRRRRTDRYDESRLRVLERCNIGPKQQILRVRVAERELLIGATDRKLHVLVDLSSPPPASASASTAATTPATPTLANLEFRPPSARIEGSANVTQPGDGGGAPSPRQRIDAFRARLDLALREELSGVRPMPKAPGTPTLGFDNASAGSRATGGTHDDPPWTRLDEVA